MKPAILLMLVCTLLLPVAGCSTDIGYLWKQGGSLVRDNMGSVDIRSLLRSPDTNPETKTFLWRVQDIKSYAVGEIGLKDDAGYSRYKEIDRDYLVNVVQACDAVSFAPYYWSYPILGNLPYKGFYDAADAQAEAARLKNEGYDVIVRRADAFSTLGVFADPIYSFMKGYSIVDLASLIIHEQTHATVFIKGQSQFNEELATFVGDQGGLEYIAAMLGRDSPEHREAVSARADSELFLGFLKELRAALDAVYTSGLSRQEKLDRKAGIIAEYVRDFKTDYAGRFHDGGYLAAVGPGINNAYLSLYDIYNTDIPLLTDYYTKVCGSSLKTFMEKVKVLARSGEDVPAAMRRELGS
jgi:predicted aminopeptidase